MINAGASDRTARPLVFQVWRETCRHIALSESCESVFVHLREHLPLSALLVRRLDLAESSLETIAGAGDWQSGTAAARSPLPPPRMKRVLVWQRRGRPLTHSSRAGVEMTALLPAGVDPRRCAILPLAGTLAPGGLLIAVARSEDAWGPRRLELLAELTEPFSIALENDRRLHEITMLREAAEADKRALLGRLGRRELGAERIVGTDSGLRHVMDRVDKVARSDVPILILGETGTGKEVVARCVHARSRRADGPFLRVNCGAIPPELIDSQLFGHERGSFTGATDTHQGWFERASGGTLFLDEIGELPPAAQVRFLRVLQDEVIERVGGRATVPVNVRIVAATHRDLGAMVRGGQFRQDLWFRVNVFPIDLPALRERPEDIPEMAAHFVEKAATRFGMPPVRLTPDDLHVLLSYDWPGNVRELAAVIDRAVLLSKDGRLDVQSALGRPRRDNQAGIAATTEGASSAVRSGTRVEDGAVTPSRESAAAGSSATTLDDAMRAHIEAALRQALGRVEGPFGAAKQLGINPHTLRARMRKLGVNWKLFRVQ